MERIDRTGEEKYNNFGSKMVITRYKNNKDMDVYFPEYNYTKQHVLYDKYVSGMIKCPYEPRLHGVGYLGEGIYTTKQNGKFTSQYIKWKAMMDRCYSSEGYDAYKDCYVCNEWLNFQNFASWYDENYYEVNGEIMCLDKDILLKHNKIYSPNTCIFVPQRINMLFIHQDKFINDENLPIGVVRYHNKYKAKFKKYKGLYNTPEEAFLVYKECKEKAIKEVADSYKDMIPLQLYEAMYNYEVEITD